MSKSCSGLLKDLVHCLRESECFQVEKKDIKTCAKEAEECAGLRAAYAACKRGQLDPRTRIRGNKGY
ncbi:hypothetical protein M9434_000362 [Picochlorum sp. BPE23]|nr:hypothetical protein M9434_000362 [Picochlorum sp. BPE23]KAI8106398.1 hypothetical protein M9435_000942 [Picochlorum sp. BPE23]